MTITAVREALDGTASAAEASLWLRDDERPFALVGEWAGVEALLGSAPARVPSPDADPFALLDDQPPVASGNSVAVGGGWFGWLGYRLGERVEALPPAPPAPVWCPPWSLAFHDHVVVRDGGRWYFEALWSEERDAALRERLELWRTRLASPPPRPGRAGGPRLSPVAPGAAGHRAAVAECVTRIAEGEIFQANLCLRLEGAWSGAAIDLFTTALPKARPRLGAFFGRPAGAIVSLSPERFLRRRDRRVETEPIKGTGDDPTALRASAKDAAEHVMIVDLMRNDLGRVCAYGTVAAAPPRVEPHAGVWHLVSTVSGALRPEATDADLLRATFPPGSVTGAPKVQAMKVIAELESTRREAYTGAIGFASPVAGLELSVAIRTFECVADRIWLGVGGGIVADSTPDGELAEALAKARGPVEAILGRVSRTICGQLAPPMPRALDHGARPDPALGVFATILVVDGAAVELDAHLARLGASVRELYGRELPPGLRERAESAARETRARAGAHRLRIDAIASPGDLNLSLTLAPVGERPERSELTPYLLSGGLGRHKWADRRLLAALLAHAGPNSVPLLVDSDGAVLEASWANVWAVEGGARITPPADGRILPGVHRARILRDDPNAREEPLDLDRLRAADAVLLTSALGETVAQSPS